MQLPSCGPCRARKLKCDGTNTGQDSLAIKPCTVSIGISRNQEIDGIRANSIHQRCREWELQCTYLYKRRRRGRVNVVVERLREQQSNAGVTDQSAIGENVGDEVDTSQVRSTLAVWACY
jgi:hypothetical protein